MIEKLKGVIFSSVSYSESSKVLQIYTKEHGKIGVISKGCKSLKSKLRSVSSNLTYGYFYVIYKKNGLSILTEVDVIDDFSSIKTNLSKIGYLTYIIDLTNQVIKESDSDKIFDLFEAAIKKISQGFDPLVIANILELKYLTFLGVGPVLDCCSVCGKSNSIITINASSGGYICKSCYTNEYIVSPVTVKLIRMFYCVDINKIKELNIKDVNKMEINSFLEDYYSRYTALYLKSKNFLNQINIKDYMLEKIKSDN